jgi:hypothetical protein
MRSFQASLCQLAALRSGSIIFTTTMAKKYLEVTWRSGEDPWLSVLSFRTIWLYRRLTYNNYNFLKQMLNIGFSLVLIVMVYKLILYF